MMPSKPTKRGRDDRERSRERRSVSRDGDRDAPVRGRSPVRGSTSRAENRRIIEQISNGELLRQGIGRFMDKRTEARRKRARVDDEIQRLEKRLNYFYEDKSYYHDKEEKADEILYELFACKREKDQKRVKKRYSQPGI